MQMNTYDINQDESSLSEIDNKCAERVCGL